ncbi:MAG: hypothetical protein QNJ45_05325 [Ardenticatenaceae bacterium]|nr:hypothetical protein [Ardenticatenaceae bacterium]
MPLIYTSTRHQLPLRPTLRAVLTAVRQAQRPVILALDCPINISPIDGRRETILHLHNDQGSEAKLFARDLAAMTGAHIDLLVLFDRLDDEAADFALDQLIAEGVPAAVLVNDSLEADQIGKFLADLEKRFTRKGFLPQGKSIRTRPVDPHTQEAPLSAREEAQIAALAEIMRLDPAAMSTTEKRELLTQAAQIQTELDKLTLKEKAQLQRQNIIDHWLAQAREAVRVIGDESIPQGNVLVLLQQMEQVAQQLATDELLGATGLELAAFLRATAAYLQGDPQPKVPPRFAAEWDEMIQSQ